MKRVLTILFAALISFVAVAQNYDTTLKFLGIPIDGPRSKMISALKQKGFIQDPNSELLIGEFNGRKSHVGIADNRGKVYRIYVADTNTCDEAQIRIRFNTLLHQFENSNGKYLTPFLVSNEPISDDEDISYEMAVHNKTYTATFVYNPAYNNEELRKSIHDELVEQAKKAIEMFYGDDGKEDEMSDESYQVLADNLFPKRIQEVSNGIVWYTISEFRGKYYISMYYDNLNNQANGEDL